MKKYTALHLVMMEDLNPHHNLYAGRGADWMMENAFIAAAIERGDANALMNKNTHKFVYEKSAVLGDIVSVESMIARVGGTSITVYTELVNAITREVFANGFMTFVAVKPGTHEPERHGIKLDPADDPKELAIREEANGFFAK